jgi:O-antigen biosynthesis protein WbqP
MVLICTAIFILPCLLIVVLIKLETKGPVLFWSERIGQFDQPFMMPKFRSMRIETPLVATDQLNSPNLYITNVGRFLRVTSLDEIPQLWSIAVGKMSFVGPRPALFNQTDLIQARKNAGVNILLPGLTGWAQVNGRDEIPLNQKVQLDHEYLKNISLLFDIKILLLTFRKVVFKEGISH